MKKIFALLIIIMTNMTLAVCAADSEITIMQPIGEPSESGYQEYGIFDTDGNLVEPAERTDNIFLFGNEDLPEKYDSRDYGYISPVRNQGVFGTCWAHAFVACAEANMIKKGYEEYFNNYSELHLVYFCHKRNEVQGDGVDVFTEGYGYFGGGNGFRLAQLAESFQGLAVESDFPYSQISSSSDFSIDEKFRNHSDIHLVDYGKVNSAEEAKKAIMEYGAISLSYAAIDGYLSDDFGYYQNETTQTNHEVTVVGWDDNFPVEKFSTACRPSNPGAWLIKNSYGKKYGDFGYFWLSYEDPSLNLNFYYEFEPIADDVKVHSYNGGVAGLCWKVSKAANVFEAKEDQTVYAVSFDSFTNEIVPEKYEINIYVSDGAPSNPESGTHKAKLTGNIAHDGFHRINIETPIELKEGQYISVVVRQTDSSNKNAASIFEAGDDFTSRKGESYVYTGGRWKNTYNYTYGGYDIKNTTIKAYYKTNTATVTFNTRKNGEFDTQTVMVGECIEKPQDPVMEGYEFLGWYTNNTVTEAWDFSQPVMHSMVLFAKWSEPDNMDLKVKSRYFCTSYKPTLSFSADHVNEFRIYYVKDEKVYAQTVAMDTSNLGYWYSFGQVDPGEYRVFAEVTGINGEEISSDIESFILTDQPVLSIHEGYVNIVNIPPYGADLYVAQYDDNGQLLGVKKTTYYRSYASNGVDIITHKSFKNATNLHNPKYFLWDAGKIIPLCISEQ